jgi:hypothetical protein
VIRVPGRRGAAPAARADERVRGARGHTRGPRSHPRAAGERGRLQLQFVQDLVEELDGGVSVALAGNVNGLAEPESRPIHGDRPHALKTFEQRKERERGRAAAVQEQDRWAFACLDDVDAST